MSRRLVGKTAEEVAASEALERLAPQRAEEVRRRLAEFSAEVESLARTLWDALAEAASQQGSAPLGTSDTTERAKESSIENLFRAARVVLADKKIPGEVKARLHDTLEYIRGFLVW